ncbi:IS5 family transposase [Streptomyces sp. NPDC090085]|uniref:IS5 family transposase n=1 Tax=Streptomyces sp. NPDC090085 TaxID=3365943 RepID=UPI00381F4C03
MRYVECGGRIEPLMPADPVRGRRWADHRRTLEVIAWKYRTCSPWRDLPDELGPLQTAHKRLIRWAVGGTWERILASLSAAADDADDIGWTVSVDSARLPRPPARRWRQEKRGAPDRAEPDHHALRRSRGGLSTKVHLASDSLARPLALRVTANQADDAPAFEVGHRLR